MLLTSALYLKDSCMIHFFDLQSHIFFIQNVISPRPSPLSFVFSRLAFKVLMSMVAQEQPMEHHVPFANPPLASEHLRSQLARIDTTSSVNASGSVPQIDQFIQERTLETSETKASDDDEVQFVFSAPRRRKRKRRRYATFYL